MRSLFLPLFILSIFFISGCNSSEEESSEPMYTVTYSIETKESTMIDYIRYSDPEKGMVEVEDPDWMWSQEIQAPAGFEVELEVGGFGHEKVKIGFEAKHGSISRTQYKSHESLGSSSFDLSISKELEALATSEE